VLCLEKLGHVTRIGSVTTLTWMHKCAENSGKRYWKYLTQNYLYRDRQLFLKFRDENVIKKKNKPDPVLVQTSYLSNETKKGNQNLVRISL
jgi:hypothetical protein